MVDFYSLALAKKEATYGVDSVPTAAANAALTRNLTVKPIATDRIDRNLDRPVRGRRKDAVSNQRQTVSYELEAAGSGAAGTAPAWMEHLEFCGMAVPTLTAATSAVQRFAALGTALSSGTLYTWNGNQKRVGLGARGTFSFDFTANAYPFFKIDLTALLPTANPVTDANPPAPDLTRWIDPVEVNTANTDFSLGGYSPVLKSITGDANANVKARNLVGANYIQRGNHGITGRIVIEATTIAQKNYFTNLQVGDEIAFTLTHGVDPGNIVELASTHLQVTDIEQSNEDDVLLMTISYGLNVGATNDDLVITAR